MCLQGQPAMGNSHRPTAAKTKQEHYIGDTIPHADKRD